MKKETLVLALSALLLGCGDDKDENRKPVMSMEFSRQGDFDRIGGKNTIDAGLVYSASDEESGCDVSTKFLSQYVNNNGDSELVVTLNYDKIQLEKDISTYDLDERFFEIKLEYETTDSFSVRKRFDVGPEQLSVEPGDNGINNKIKVDGSLEFKYEFSEPMSFLDAELCWIVPGITIDLKSIVFDIYDI